jgi:hypothetical protein
MPMPVRSLAELQLDELIRNKAFTPSPTAWGVFSRAGVKSVTQAACFFGL